MLGPFAAPDRPAPNSLEGRGQRRPPRPARLRPAARPQLEALDVRVLLSGVPTPDHVVLAIEENHLFSEIVGSPYAPYINALVKEGALFTQSFAIEHPSLPNYLDLFSGSNQGITTDTNPSQPLTAPNLGAELIGANLSFASYAEDLPSVGSTAITSGNYARRHNPAIDWEGAATNAVPAADNQPFSAFPADFSTLPTFSYVVPNVAHDMHDGTDPTKIQVGDAWLKANLDPYIQWAQTHNSLFILTFDESDNGGTNQITTLFLGPMVTPGSYSETIDHYSVLRTVEDMYSLPYAGASATATPITDVWRPTTGLVTGNGTPGYSEAGTWTDAAGYGGYNNNYRYAAPGNGSTTASWQTAGLAPGTYDVQVTWGAGSNRATNAPYQIYDGNTLLATLPVNQKVAPSGPTVDGVTFQSLGLFTINSGTVRVVLSNAANGYVVADAVRIAPPPGPIVTDEFLDPGYTQAGAWTDAIGYGGYNNSYRYAAPGNGSSTASWQTTGLAPGSYDVQVTWAAGSNRATNAPYLIYDGTTLIATVTVNQKLAPSGPSAGGVAFQSLGQFTINSGTVRVVLSNAANGYVIADATRITPSPAAIVTDNGTPGYSEAGTWTAAAGYGGYYGDYRYAAPGSGSTTATWQATGLAPASYDVQVTWGAGSNRATNAPYQIYDGNTLLATVTVNQRIAPSGPLVNGVVFQSLGAFRVTSGTLRVVLTNNANGYVVADALRVAPPAPPPVLLDDAGQGYAESGPWTSAVGYGGYENRYRYAAPGTGQATATWQTSGLPAGSYDVQVTWGAGPNRATNAPYQIYDGNRLLATIPINQQSAPSGVSAGGAAFQSLGVFSLTSGTLRVVLSNNANGYVIADAVRIGTGGTLQAN